MAEPRTESDSDSSSSEEEETTDIGTISDKKRKGNDFYELPFLLPSKKRRDNHSGMAGALVHYDSDSSCDEGVNTDDEVPSDKKTIGNGKPEQNPPIKTIKEPLTIRIKISSTDEVEFQWKQEKCKEKAHSSVLYFAFSSPVIIPRIMETLAKNKVTTNTNGLEGGLLEFDLCERKLNQKQDAFDFVYTILKEFFLELDTRQIKRNSNRYKIMERSILTGTFPALAEGSVKCYQSSLTEDLYLVGMKSSLKLMLDELIIPLTEERTELIFPESELRIPIQLGLEEYLKQQADVEIKSPSDKFIVSYDTIEEVKVDEIMRKFKTNIGSETVNLQRKEFETLLTAEDHSENPAVLAYLEKQLKLNNIKAAIEMQKHIKYTNLFVYCRDKEHLQTARETIKNSFQTLTLNKNEYNEKLTSVLNEWREKKKLVLSERGDETEVFCTADVFSIIQETIQVEEEIKLPPLAALFLTRLGRNIILALKEEIGLDDVSVDQENLCLHLKGRQLQIAAFRKRFAGKYHLEKVPMKSSQSILAQAEAVLQDIAESHICILELKPSGQHRKHADINCPALVSWTSCQKNIKLTISKCTMKKLHVECKVSFTTDLLCPLARSSSDSYNEDNIVETTEDRYRLGERIWDTPFSLPAMISTKQPVNVKLVVYSNTSPNTSSTNPDDFLEKNIQKTFKEAFDRSLKSIAVPLHLPNDTFSAKQIAAACLKAAFTISKSGFVEIFLQTWDAGSVEDVINYIDTFCHQQKQVIYRESFANDLPEIPGNATMSVQVDLQSIISVKADVLVNTVGSDLDLTNGALSRQIVNAAGESVMVECKDVYKEEGEICITNAGKLSKEPTCVKHIFHCVLPKFKKNTLAEDIKNMVKKCLLEVDKRVLKSIVFPAFGTGQLGYPVRDTAQAMFDAVEEYKQFAMNSKIERVVFSILKTDQDSLETFKHEEKRRKANPLFNRNRIGGYNGVYTDVGPSHNTARFQIAARDDIKMIPSSFVVVILDTKKKESIHPLKIQFASEDPTTDNDMLRVYIKEETLQKDLENAFSFLYKRKVTDIVIYTIPMNGYSETDQIQAVKEALQETLKKYTQELFRDIIVAVQQIDARLSDNFLQSQKSGIFHSITSWFLSKKEPNGAQQWNPCREEDVPITIQIIGHTRESCEQVKAKVKAYFRSGAQSTIDPTSQAKGNIKRTQYEENWNSANDITVEESVEHGQSDMKNWTERVSATVNSGIIQHLHEINQLERWLEGIQKKYRLHVQRTQKDLVNVCGNFDDILQFESDLEILVNDTEHSLLDTVSTQPVENGPESSLFELGGETLISPPSVNDPEHSYLKLGGDIVSTQYVVNDNTDSVLEFTGDTVSTQTSEEGNESETAELAYLASFDLNGIEVRVLHKNITEMKVDCIVNSASEKFGFTTGVSKAIANAAGDSYKRDCESERKNPLAVGEVREMKPGNLKCRVVFQARGPNKKTHGSERDNLIALHDTVKLCLKKADSHQFTSIAFTSIGAGMGGIDKNKCGQEYFRAVVNFLPEKKTLKHVYFVDTEKSWTDLLESIFQEQYRYFEKKNKDESSKVPHVKNLQWFMLRTRNNSDTVLVEVSTEPVQNQNVVAVVSTEDEYFRGQGAIASSLIKLGDPVYKEAHSKLYTVEGKQNMGYVTVTKICGEQIRFTHVIHTVIPLAEHNDDTFYSNIENIVTNIMEKAAEKKFDTIAMPILGLNSCPHLEMSCKATVDAICSYTSSHRRITKSIVLSCVDQAVEHAVKDILSKKALLLPVL